MEIVQVPDNVPCVAFLTHGRRYDRLGGSVDPITPVECWVQFIIVLEIEATVVIRE